MAYLTTATLAFAAILVLVELARLGESNARTEPISHYLTGPLGWLEDAAFMGLAVALFFASAGHPAYIAMGIGLIGVTATKACAPFFGTWAHKLHITSAGACFLAAAVAMFLAGWHTYFAAYVVAGALSILLVPKDVSLQEKIPAALICIWLVSVSS